MLFALVAHDKPNSVERRLEIRPDHLKFLETMGTRVQFAGPFLDDAGKMIGTFMVIEAENQEEAEATFARDPYAQGELFASQSVKPFRVAVNNLCK